MKEALRERLVFDSTGKALVFESKWTNKVIYTFTGFVGLATLSNFSSYFGTNKPEYFSEVSKQLADWLGTLGAFSLIGIVILAPRLVQKIHVMKNMSQVEIFYFQVFRPQPPQIIKVSELQNLRYFHLNFHRLDLENSKPIFINLHTSALDSHSANHRFLTELTHLNDDKD